MNRQTLSTLNTVCAALLALAAAPAALAADTPSPPPAPAAAAAPADPLAGARARIASKQWGAAIEELKRVNATGSADWNNLMGYSLRKQATPDLDGAQRFYDAALRIDPQHKGALEYSGELALMKKDIPTAEARLAALQRACPGGCEELEDLKRSIARAKAAKP
jgi:tetratricopeptide (TPR) repeat protein